MNRNLLIRTGITVVVVALLASAWQVAYARGKDEGIKEAVTARTEFAQTRQPGAGPAGGGQHGDTPPGGGQAGGQRGGQGGDQFGGQRPAVNGTIEKVEAKTVTVATSEGPVKVTLVERTQIRKQVPASASELKTGDHVVIVGEKTGDKEYTANAIQVQSQ